MYFALPQAFLKSFWVWKLHLIFLEIKLPFGLALIIVYTDITPKVQVITPNHDP